LKSLNISSEEKGKYDILDNDNNEEAGIPKFWCNAIKNSKFFAVNENDEKVLVHLRDVKLVLNEDKKLDYTVEFIFNENEFFKDEKLTLEYIYDEKKFEPIKKVGKILNWSNKEKNPTIDIKTKKIKSNLNIFTLKTLMMIFILN